MAQKVKQTGDGRGDNRLHTLVGDDTMACHVDLPRLTPSDVKKLWAIIDGETRPSWRLNQKRVFSALVRADPGQKTANYLAQNLENENASSNIRAAAAYYLGGLTSALSEDVLLKAAAAGPLMVRVEAMGALGRVGSTRALKVLADLEFDDEGWSAIWRQRDAALLAIAIRTKNNEVADAAFESLDRPSWKTSATREMKSAEIKAALGQIASATPEIAFDPAIGVAFSCAGMEHYLLVNEEMTGALKSKASLKGPIIAGIIGAAEVDGLYLAPRWTVIAKPHGKNFDLIVMRPSGALILVGTATSSSGVIHFEVRDAGMERIPIRGQGKLSERKLQLTLEVRPSTERGKLRPRPILEAASVGERNRALQAE